jgi:uncharacterized protein YecE (DUF72 family)
MDIRIGCSGWSYRHWRGNFYPEKLPRREWLRHYAGIFDTVELNNTFYRLPSAKAVQAWRDGVPPGFCYSVKVSRFITHFRRLLKAESSLQLFFQRIEGLGPRLGPLLYQLPPDLERDEQRLEAFLRLLPRQYSHVFEFRHASWWTEDVWRLLRAHKASFCMYNLAEVSTPVIATSPVAYLRLHGPGGYNSGYSRSQLEQWADSLASLEGVRQAWVYFNNDVAGHAPRDASRLRQLLAAGRSSAND